MKLKTFVSTLASVLLIGSQVAYADKWGDQFPHIAATGDIPGMCSYEETSKKDYSGRTLTINTHTRSQLWESLLPFTQSSLKN